MSMYTYQQPAVSYSPYLSFESLVNMYSPATESVSMESNDEFETIYDCNNEIDSKSDVWSIAGSNIKISQNKVSSEKPANNNNNNQNPNNGNNIIYPQASVSTVYSKTIKELLNNFDDIDIESILRIRWHIRVNKCSMNNLQLNNVTNLYQCGYGYTGGDARHDCLGIVTDSDNSESVLHSSSLQSMQQASIEAQRQLQAQMQAQMQSQMLSQMLIEQLHTEEQPMMNSNYNSNNNNNNNGKAIRYCFDMSGRMVSSHFGDIRDRYQQMWGYGVPGAQINLPKFGKNDIITFDLNIKNGTVTVCHNEGLFGTLGRNIKLSDSDIIGEFRIAISMGNSKNSNSNNNNNNILSNIFNNISNNNGNNNNNNISSNGNNNGSEGSSYSLQKIEIVVKNPFPTLVSELSQATTLLNTSMTKMNQMAAILDEKKNQNNSNNSINSINNGNNSGNSGNGVRRSIGTKYKVSDLVRASNKMGECESYLKQMELLIGDLRVGLVNCNKLLKSKMNVNPESSNYELWSINDIMIWLNSLENGRFSQYSDVLEKSFIQNDIKSTDLPDITRSDLNQFGVSIFRDRVSLAQYFQSLKHTQTSSNMQTMQTGHIGQNSNVNGNQYYHQNDQMEMDTEGQINTFQ